MMMNPLPPSQELIPNLPYDLARDCFLRLSVTSLPSLRAVCRQWNHLLNSPDFYLERREKGLSDISVCLIQAQPDAPQGGKHSAYGVALYDPKRESWDALPPLPDFPDGLPLFCQCVAVQHSLVLLGGWNPVTWAAMPCVYIFDFLTGKWRRGNDMLGARSFFACGVMGCLVLVAGGHDDNKNALNTAEVYNLELDEWQALPSMSQERDEPKGVVMDSKFYVISGYTTQTQGQFVSSAEIFSASTCCWERVEDMWPSAAFPAFVMCVEGHLLTFHRHDVMHFNWKTKAWEVIDKVPDAVKIAPCATVVRDKIFVTGTKGFGEASAFLYAPAKAMDGPGKWKFIKHFESLARGACSLEI